MATCPSWGKPPILDHALAMVIYIAMLGGDLPILEENPDIRPCFAMAIYIEMLGCDLPILGRIRY